MIKISCSSNPEGLQVVQNLGTLTLKSPDLRALRSVEEIATVKILPRSEMQRSVEETGERGDWWEKSEL